MIRVFLLLLFLVVFRPDSQASPVTTSNCIKRGDFPLAFELLDESQGNLKNDGASSVCRNRSHPIEYALMESLAFLETHKEIRFGQRIHPALGEFKAVEGSLWTYLTERVKQFRWGPELSCVPRLSAYISQGKDGVVHLCPDFVGASVLKRVLILIHEARHFEGYKHETCDGGPKQGLRGCDRSVEFGGSHAVELAALSALWPQLSAEEKDGQDFDQILFRTLESSFNRVQKGSFQFKIQAWTEEGQKWEYDPRTQDFTLGSSKTYELAPGPHAVITEEYVSLSMRGYMFQTEFEQASGSAKPALLVEASRHNPMMWHRHFVDGRGELFEFDLERESDPQTRANCRDLVSDDEQRACLHLVELRSRRRLFPVGLAQMIIVGEEFFGLTADGLLAHGRVGEQYFTKIASPLALPTFQKLKITVGFESTK